VRPRGEGDCPVRRVGASSTGQRGLGGVGTIAVMAQASAGERRTKIVATIGPASSTRGQLRGLIASGMDASRVNFAHGIARRTPTSSPACGLWPPGSVSPWLSFRTRRAPRSVWAPWPGGECRAGSRTAVRTHHRPRRGLARARQRLLRGPARGGRRRDALLLAEGAIQLRVDGVSGSEIWCRVIVGGQLSSRKSINVPSGLPDLPILGDKDLEDLRFSLARGVDFVGLSFVRTAGDVVAAGAHVAALGGDVPLIAKIETRSALDHFGEILEAADGIMIARGDLGIETPFARVPIVQKQLIARANRRARPVITATQMLYSMVESPQPTLAEVADVANAVLDGSDAVMLSEETAIGRDPARAVRVMALVAAEAERGQRDLLPPASAAGEREAGDAEAIVEAACQLVARQRAGVIVTFTRAGETARFAASCWPAQPVLAFTDRPDTYRTLALVHGVVPRLLAEPAAAGGASLDQGRRLAGEHGWRGERAVVVSGDRVGRRHLMRSRAHASGSVRTSAMSTASQLPPPGSHSAANSPSASS
jgi:pyruvate kinase